MASVKPVGSHVLGPASGAASLPGAAAGRHPIRVGSVLIPPCKASRLAWCTTIRVPYDYFNRAAGTIGLGFRWYPATGGPSSRTIVAVQGGPGYPTTDYAYAYRAMLFPLLAKRNLLLVDLRGTGTSSPFTCKALQGWTLQDSIASYTADTGACGRQLNHTRKLRGGHGYVQASDLYTRPLTRLVTWPCCCASCGPARSTSTATPTGPSSARSSRPASTRCCAR